jgi:cytochrome c peroxidase
MKRSSTTTLILSLFLFLIWSCSKESKPAPITPNLPVTAYSYSTNNEDKMVMFSKISITILDRGGSIGTLNSLSGLVPKPTSNNNSATLGRVIFYDNGISLNLGNTSCNGCHGKTGINTVEVSAAYQNKGSAAHSSIYNSLQMIEKMKAKAYYAQLFIDAYSTPDITTDRIADALAQYMTSMKSAGSQETLANDPRFADPFR